MAIAKKKSRSTYGVGHQDPSLRQTRLKYAFDLYLETQILLYLCYSTQAYKYRSKTYFKRVCLKQGS
jgi:hypothetical protein